MKFEILTVEQFVARHQRVFDRLTEQETRIAAKTMLFTAIEYNRSREHSMQYIKSIAPMQRDALKKFFSAYQEVDPKNADAFAAFSKEVL